jgi:signal transduction histidine kinase
MHSSQDLSLTISLFFAELRALNVIPHRCGVSLVDIESRVADFTATAGSEEGQTKEMTGKLKLADHPVLDAVFDSWKKQEEYHPVLRGEEIKKYYQAMNPQVEFPDYSKDKAEFGHYFPFKEGFVFCWTEKELQEEQLQIFRKFTSVLSLTHRRYMDLKEAEAQAREAKIETALERVRSKAMAMHSSEDLAETIKVFYQQLGLLNLMPRRCGVGLIDTETHVADLSGMIVSEQGEAKEITGKLKLAKHPVLKKVYDNWVLQKEYHPVLRGNEIKEYYGLIGSQISFQEYLPDAVQFGYFFYFPEGAVYAWREKEFSEAELKIYRRFTTVLSLTYKRYMDLKLAESQAREATIEAALEKVRGKAMAMHNSNDLSVTASMVFTELRKLGVNSIRSGVGLLTKENRKVILYAATSSEEGDNLSLVGWAMLEDHAILSKIYDSWISNEDYFPVLKGELLKTYYEKILSNFAVPGSHYEKNLPGHALTDVGYEQHGHFLAFSEGFLYGWSEKPYTETEIKILNRFKLIIDLTFRRYMELQKSEANAREAVKQAALDRVRAEIASMRTTGDLERITPLIWSELTILGIPFIRCGVFIMDEAEKLIHTFLSTPDGKAIAAFHIPYDTPGNISQVLSHWHDKETYLDHWDESAFTEFAGTLVKQGVLTSPDQYLSTLPRGGFYLHFLPFLQGMLYVGNTTQLGEDEIKLLQSVADAFSTAYARYEDFNKLEAAKQQVDKTLVDLKQAQQQLVQSEKMASLGELTAGIAHEIQNPLNFVNNFSEVSNELLDEMITELEKNNKEDAIAIADDVKQNLEKILHHGKRADGIVKGMLQHSRSSSGQKEPTDINVLTDEYLRLAYHGLRAKDKSFNAKFETEFDFSIEKINVIPQEIGRVILNLINNAFYAVTERKKQSENGYEPTVKICTKKLNDRIEIKVKDNGNGIPQKVLDKIFQPFFTTKPTGQGTGLGLSLSYDIVKAHGGELKVETKEGEFAEFNLILPV